MSTLPISSLFEHESFATQSVRGSDYVSGMSLGRLEILVGEPRLSFSDNSCLIFLASWLSSGARHDLNDSFELAPLNLQNFVGEMSGSVLDEFPMT